MATRVCGAAHATHEGTLLGVLAGQVWLLLLYHVIVTKTISDRGRCLYRILGLVIAVHCTSVVRNHSVN